MVEKMLKMLLRGAVCAVPLCFLDAGAAAEVPAKIREFESVEVTGKDFRRISGFAKYGLEAVDDADAASGRAMALRKHPQGKDLHSGTAFNMGIYCDVNKKTLANWQLAKTAIPQDEKYHFYRIGKAQASKALVIYGHKSWAMQQKFTNLVDEKDPRGNLVEVYASVKFTGPAYVKGSKLENGIFVDRIIFTRIGLPTRKSADSPLMAELQGKMVNPFSANDFYSYRRFAKNGLKLVDDADAADGKAICLGANPAKPALHKSPYRMGIFSNKTKKQLAFRALAPESIAQDEKYHLINIGRITLTENCYFWGHNSWVMQQDLNPVFKADIPGDKPCDVYVSVKFTGPSYVAGSKLEDAVYIDRILFVQ